MIRLTLLSTITVMAVATPSPGAQTAPAFPVQIRVDTRAEGVPFTPLWRFFGADEPNYATMKDGRRLLSALGSLRPGQVYFRAHNMLSSGDGTPALKWGSTNVYTEDTEGRPVYDFEIVDRIFDTYLARGVRPFVQLGFMPEALSRQPQPYQHEWRPGMPYEQIITGWAYPPKDYNKWRDLAAEWTRHCIQRYGRAEVEQWYWEVWNEPNGHYWKGTPDEWYALHDYAIDGIRRVLPTARVGGPHTAGSGGAFMDGFLKHITSGTNHATGTTGTPTDFLAFHAKGSPEFVDGHVRMGISAQLKTIDNGLRKISAYPELKNKPVILGESDPDGCAACQGPQLGYRNGTLYSSYTAASFARKYLLADRHGMNLEGAVTWAFEFEDQPYFAGQRVLSTNGIELPVLNVFRLLSRLEGQRIPTESTAEVNLDDILARGVRENPDVAALAVRSADSLRILVWHYHDDDLPGGTAQVSLNLNSGDDLAGAATVWRVDGDHANAFSQWLRLGSPGAPNPNQYAALADAAALKPYTSPLIQAGGSKMLTLEMPRQGVALVEIPLKAR